jgi:hypothetical protein
MSTTKIRIVPEPDSTSGGMASGSSALAPRENDAIVLRFRIQADEESFEALRAVRRSMLREESTLGRGEGEPSFVDAIFSSDGIVWAVLPGQKQLCLDRIAALEERVARALNGLTGGRLTPSSRF